MATYNIFKLKNITPLHIGIGKDDYDFSANDLCSDTISSALAAMRTNIIGDKTDVEGFLNSFSISSAFPFIKDEYFLPSIKGKLENISVLKKDNKEFEEESKYRKKLKKVRYLSKDIFNDIIQNKKVNVIEDQIQDEFIFAIKDKNIDNKRPYCSQVMQRVSVSRDENVPPTPFSFQWKYFNKDCGLYCITDAKGDKLEELKILFSILGEQGIGSGKMIGGGKFDVENSTIDILDAPNSNYCMLLSMFIPLENEIESLNLKESRYDLILRGGFMAAAENENNRHLWKKSIYMFNQGSIFKTTNKLNGKIVNLRPNWNDKDLHNVYRSGKAFCLPIKIKE